MPHDTILVAEGEYLESLGIGKPLTLLGAGQEKTLVWDLDSALGISSDSVKVDGFTLHAEFMQTMACVLWISSCSPTITNVTLTSSGGSAIYGIICGGNGSPQIHQCNLQLGITLWYDSLDVYAENNWWGTTDEFGIRQKIGDGNDTDDPYSEGLGIVHYKPFLTEPVAVESKEQLFTSFTLHQNYPNPFNSSTAISYNLLKDGYIRLYVYDLTGKLISTLEDRFRGQGTYVIHWNGKNSNNVLVSSGVYLSRLEMDNQFLTKKLIVIK